MKSFFPKGLRLGAKQKTILVADDSEAVTFTLEALLKDRGYNVLIAADGKIAIEMAIEHAPDLVITDIMMPEVHGLAACEAIKKHPKLTRTKVLVLSAKSFSADRHQAERVGADAFLAKPYDAPVLLETVARLLNS